MKPQQTFHAASHFFPVLLVKTEPGEPARIVEHLGTGFFLFPDVLITCWHCVADKPPAGHEYAIRVEVGKENFKAYYLRGIERDANGTDMATAICPYKPPVALQLCEEDLLLGEEVWAFGYPYPEVRRSFEGNIHHVISGRFLRGYMTRRFFYEHPELGKTSSYELDMLAPRGTSGAALLRKNTIQVAGVIFGVADVETIEEFSRVDPHTGQREPEVRRIASFALAYDFEAIGNLTTSATNHMPLKQFLRLRAGG